VTVSAGESHDNAVIRYVGYATGAVPGTAVLVGGSAALARVMKAGLVRRDDGYLVLTDAGTARLAWLERSGRRISNLSTEECP
jgi:hypothetical protein